MNPIGDRFSDQIGHFFLNLLSQVPQYANGSLLLLCLLYDDRSFGSVVIGSVPILYPLRTTVIIHHLDSTRKCTDIHVSDLALL